MAKFTETAGTLTNNTVSLAAKDRAGLMVGNPSDTVMTVRFGATAGLPVPAGTTLSLTGALAPDDAVSVFCAGSSKAYAIYEW